jgi:hypothetical protein
LNHKLIEKSIKVYKTHRNTKDFDDKFVRSLGLYDEEVRKNSGVKNENIILMNVEVDKSVKIV